MGDPIAAERDLSAEGTQTEEARSHAFLVTAKPPANGSSAGCLRGTRRKAALELKPTVIAHSSRALSEQSRIESRSLFGVIACLIACFTAGFAGDSSARASNRMALSDPDGFERTDAAPAVCDVEKYGEGVEWSTDLDEAMTRGRAEGKPVLVAFSALRQEPGCGPESEY